MKKRIAILGSTGSIGKQALEIIRIFPEKFSAEILTADSNANLLIQQALEFMPNAVVITNDTYYQRVKSALEPHDIKVYAGHESLEQIVESENIDMVLTAIVGFAGLRPTLNAIRYKKTLALANKETLVVAGDVITRTARKEAVNIFPVDSEHSAIFQCLAGEFHNPLEKIILTASGGPFRGKDRAALANITKAEALRHPNWVMGNKITIDSATLMNKGLEVIEARWLFNLKPEQIEVLVHPQSIIHSMVEFADGSLKAQMGLPDMRLPILYAFNYPSRLKTDFPKLDWQKIRELTFEPPDTKTFHALTLAYEALKTGGNMPCILNAANEIAVKAFLTDTIKFLAIADVIEQGMKKAAFIKNPSLEDYLQSDRETRIITQEIIKNNYK
ncbi:MAG TPA: 1-deoxy-D-xylulose-5-phosphate reductoisomerase [Bacteroidales bacterium]|nr:1-deoxy-D-xylulose-5-phosphate reductoisomerase [Bacteroidales bacterium]